MTAIPLDSQHRTQIHRLAYLWFLEQWPSFATDLVLASQIRAGNLGARWNWNLVTHGKPRKRLRTEQTHVSCIQLLHYGRFLDVMAVYRLPMAIAMRRKTIGRVLLEHPDRSVSQLDAYTIFAAGAWQFLRVRSTQRPLRPTDFPHFPPSLDLR